MLRKHAARGRVLTALLTAAALLAALPSTALAEDQGLWTQWASEVTNRESKAEIPIAIVTTFPLLFVVTPFWLVGVAIEEITAEDETDPADD